MLVNPPKLENHSFLYAPAISMVFTPIKMGGTQKTNVHTACPALLSVQAILISCVFGVKPKMP